MTSFSKISLLHCRQEAERDWIMCCCLATHYDHIGALPYITKRWPEVVVCAAAKAKSVFKSEGAKGTMKRLGEAARDEFSASKTPVSVDGLRVDRVVKRWRPNFHRL